MSDTALFPRLGGAEGISRLVDAFYDNMEQRPEFAALRTLHAPDLTATRDVLKLYLIEWTGGPANYSAAKGHPRLRRRHMHIPIGEAERDDWMRCMTLVLHATVEDVEARSEISKNFSKLADWMRNQADNPHDSGKTYGSTMPHEPQSDDCRHVVNSTVENPTNCGCQNAET